MELRYRLMPYLYSAVRETSQTGMPIVRALWLHHPDDPAAVARGDQYLWGRDILVAPVVEKDATSRRRSTCRVAPGTTSGRTSAWTAAARSIAPSISATHAALRPRRRDRPDGAGEAVHAEQVDGPLTVTVYPGADGSFELFEDDGRSFEYRRGDWMGIVDPVGRSRSRRLTLSLTPARACGRRPPATSRCASPDGPAIAPRSSFSGRPVTCSRLSVRSCYRISDDAPHGAHSSRSSRLAVLALLLCVTPTSRPVGGSAPAASRRSHLLDAGHRVLRAERVLPLRQPGFQRDGLPARHPDTAADARARRAPTSASARTRTSPTSPALKPAHRLHRRHPAAEHAAAPDVQGADRDVADARGVPVAAVLASGAGPHTRRERQLPIRC